MGASIKTDHEYGTAEADALSQQSQVVLWKSGPR
jgi:hypothetical protein